MSYKAHNNSVAENGVNDTEMIKRLSEIGAEVRKLKNTPTNLFK
ncbi:MAG: hypothetical protein U9Q20_06055 [Campylobacterota bacterium]|nr:hypothetical protein [Campylobacterota bacterium]